MKLFNSDLSPYCNRVRYFIYSRNIACSVVTPAQDPAGFAAASPLGKVPALAMEDEAGHVIFESETINEFFAEMHQPPVFVPLLPADKFERARAREISRLVDLYVNPHIHLLWSKVTPEELAAGVAAMNKGLDAVEKTMVGPLTTSQRKPVLSDATLGALLIHVEIFGARTNFKPHETRPKIKAFWEAMLKDVDFQRVRKETQDALVQARDAAKKAAKQGKL